MKSNNTLAYRLLFLGLCLPAVAFAGTIPYEIVQTVPLETTLAVPGVRSTQEVWIEMIRSAKKSVELEQFYVDNQAGGALEPVVEEIKSAAARGVHVRLLIDSKFEKNYPKEPQNLGQLANIEVRTIDFSALGGIQHAKYFVVDDKQAFLGSANFDWRALSHIHEVGLRISDTKTVQDLLSVFELDWKASIPLLGILADADTTSNATPEPSEPGPAVVSGSKEGTFVASPSIKNPKSVQSTSSAILDLIKGAKISIQVQVYEYSTQVYGGGSRWTDLDVALRQAAARGVQVQLLVDAVSMKSGKNDLEALGKIKNVRVKTVVIPEWSGGHLDYARLIHSKYMTVDHSAAWVGTENWSGGYFTQCRNVGIVLQSPDLTSVLEQIFEKVWNSAYSKAVN